MADRHGIGPDDFDVLVLDLLGLALPVDRLHRRHPLLHPMKERSHKPVLQRKAGSDYVYPKVEKGDVRQSRAGNKRRALAAEQDLSESGVT